MDPNGRLSNDFKTAITARHAIVLIGGQFAASRDFYDTPKGRIPGVELNAYAIQAELSGLTLREFPRPLLILLDVILGLAVVCLFHVAKTFRWFILIVGLSIVAAFFISAVAFWRNIIWVSCIGVVAGMPLHVLWEVFLWNPKMPAHHHH